MVIDSLTWEASVSGVRSSTKVGDHDVIALNLNDLPSCLSFKGIVDPKISDLMLVYTKNDNCKGNYTSYYVSVHINSQ